MENARKNATRKLAMKFIKDGIWIYFIPGFVAMFVAGFISDFPTIRDAQLPIVYVTLTFICVALSLIVTHFFLLIRGQQLEIVKI